MSELDRIKRAFADKRLGRQRRAAAVAAVRSGLADEVGHHRAQIAASTARLVQIERTLSMIDDFVSAAEGAISAGGRADAGAATSSLDPGAVRAEYVARGVEPPQDGLIRLAELPPRRSADGLMWHTPLGCVHDEPARLTPKVPDIGSEHLRRVLTIPGYGHGAYITHKQRTSTGNLNEVAAKAKKGMWPSLVLAHGCVGHVFDACAADAHAIERIKAGGRAPNDGAGENSKQMPGNP